MDNEVIEPISADSLEKRNYMIKVMTYIGTATIALIASSYIWQNPFIPSSSSLSDEANLEQVVAEIRQPLPSFVPKLSVDENEPQYFSQIPDITQLQLSQHSQIAPCYLAANKQQVQPSPKRIVDIKIDDETDDSLVVRDRVVVIPKTLNLSPKPQRPVAIKRQKNSKVIYKPYTIQLIASSKRMDIVQFVKRHKIKGRVKIRISKRNGSNWYVLTIGEYKQKERAQTAIKQLPVELARYNPWIRPVGQMKGLG